MSIRIPRPLTPTLLLLVGLLTSLGGCDSPPAESTAVPPSPTVPPPPPAAPSVPPPPPGSPAATGLQAPVGAPAGKLKPVPNVPDASMYTPDGLMGDDEVVAPWFMGMVNRRESQIDNAKHAEALASRTVGGMAHQIVESRPTSIQGVEAYEFLLSATPAAPNESTPLSVYMCILYPSADKYITLRGSAKKSAEAEWLPEFRALAHSWPVNN